MLEPRYSNLPEFSTEQTGSQTPKQQHNIRFLLKIIQCWHQHKNLKKETNTSSSTNPSVGNTLCCCVYNIIPVTAVASYYVIIVGTPRSCNSSCLAVLHCGGLETQLVGVAGQRSKTRPELVHSGHASSGIAQLPLDSTRCPSVRCVISTMPVELIVFTWV